MSSMSILASLNQDCVFAELNRTRVCKNDYNDWPAVRAREGFEKAEARVEELLELGVVHRGSGDRG